MTTTSAVSSVNCKALKWGRVVHIYIEVKLAKALDQGYSIATIGTMKDKWKPYMEANSLWMTEGSNLCWYSGFYNNGVWTIWQWGGQALAAGKTLNSTITYISLY